MFRQAGTVQLYSWLKWGPVIEHRKSFLPLNFDPPNQTLIFLLQWMSDALIDAIIALIYLSVSVISC